MDGWKENYHNNTSTHTNVIWIMWRRCNITVKWLITNCCRVCAVRHIRKYTHSIVALTQNGHKHPCTKLVWCREPLSCNSGWRWDSLAVNTRAGDWGLGRLTAGVWVASTNRNSHPNGAESAQRAVSTSLFDFPLSTRTQLHEAISPQASEWAARHGSNQTQLRLCLGTSVQWFKPFFFCCPRAKFSVRL